MKKVIFLVLAIVIISLPFFSAGGNPLNTNIEEQGFDVAIFKIFLFQMNMYGVKIIYYLPNNELRTFYVPRKLINNKFFIIINPTAPFPYFKVLLKDKKPVKVFVYFPSLNCEQYILKDFTKKEIEKLDKINDLIIPFN